MKVAAMQPYFFPYLGYFQLLHAVDRFVFLDDAQYTRRGWINRNRVLVAGSVHRFVVPVRHSQLTDRICDVEVASGDWRRKLLATLRHAYGRSPHYRDILPSIEGVLEPSIHSLADLNRASVLAVGDLLGIETATVHSSAIYGNNDLGGRERMIDIALREGAQTYVNLPGGRLLYDAADFLRAGLELLFVAPENGPYPQQAEQFVPRLSVLDVLMAVGAAQTRELLTRYKLEP